jgi:GTP-binding protein Era
VTLAGRPNAGKSTLLNALVGEKLSIVTSRAQTTWERVTGIRTQGGVQMVFLDTPGLLEVRDLHQRAMLHAAHEALREADVVLLVADATRGVRELETAAVGDALAETNAPLVCAVNKIDVASDDAVGALVHWCRQLPGARVHAVSAARGDGLDELVRDLEALLPESPFLYPDEDLGSQPVRFFVAELVRETVFERFEEEIPYSVAARVEEFREEQDPVYIQVTLHVERESQKGILVGKGGQAIRGLGAAARVKIETFLGRPVYLDLWVKPLAGWRRKRHHLARLGYRVPEEGS